MADSSGVLTLNRVLLAFAPVTIALHYVHPEWSAAVFVCGCLAVIPLAGYMGEATEAIAAKAGSGVGGLLNASFGNAAELILAIAALRAGHTEVVKASLTGSILGNLLLILGLAMLAGGLRVKEQRFNVHAAISGASLMLLAVVGLFVPTIFHLLHPAAAQPILRPISVGIALVLLLLYAASLLFQLRTHAHLYGEAEEEGHDEEEHLPIPRAVVQLVVATVAVGVVSEFLVSALEGATRTFGFTETFVGVVVLATVGNAAEHSTAVTMAMKDRMSLSMAIAMESSKQIALFVAPILVVISGFFDQPMSLEFAPFEVAAVGIGVGAASVVSFDGRSNWLEGLMLLGVYVILGIAFFFTP